jgi:hypothetical protein
MHEGDHMCDSYCQDFLGKLTIDNHSTAKMVILYDCYVTTYVEAAYKLYTEFLHSN